MVETHFEAAARRSTETYVEWFAEPCTEPSSIFATAAEQHQANLTKPAGSLGRLEQLAIDLAALKRTDFPAVDPVAILVFAGDHGVTAQGVSAYPSAVTVEMLRNFARGGAAINVLARALNAPLTVIDAGTLADASIPGVLTDKQRRGTRDFSIESAMSPAELEFALAAGRRAFERINKSAIGMLILGEMGIGNTTSAAAIAAALLRRPSRDIVGAGTGLDGAGISRKAEVISKALAHHGLGGDAYSVLDVLCRVGGYEIAALSGAIIAAAQAGVPILIDGFIVTVAALAATRINPTARASMFFSHRSAEQGHRIVLDALGAEPLLDLKLRLGEGSGAAIALPLVRLACKLHAEMATFEDAQVSRKSEEA